MHLEMCALYFTSLLNKVPRVGLYGTTRYGLVIFYHRTRKKDLNDY